MSTKCDKRGLATWCNGEDVKTVQLRSQTAGVHGTNLYKGDVVHMCSECRKSNRGGVKIVKPAATG